MLKPEKNLRWLGIDMRPRWRRRAAVLITYMAVIAVVAEVSDGGWGHPLVSLTILTLAVQFIGVFSRFGPVKPFEDATTGQAQSKYIYFSGLDALARYRYDVANYDAATPEQQSDLLQSYHVGLHGYPRKPSQEGQVGLDERYWLDEREKHERAAAERWARRWLIIYIAMETGHYLNHHAKPQPLEVAGELLWIGILAMTLPAARILWTEADPRNTPGEIELVSAPTNN